MLADITIGRYFPGNSFLHRLDARVKLVLLVFLMIGVFLCAGAKAYGVFVLLVFFFTAISGVPPLTVLSALRPLWWILLFTFCMHLFAGGGETVLFSWGDLLVATKEGAANGAFMCLRLGLIIVLSSLLTLTTDPLALTDAAEALLSPLKRVGVPAHELAMMMTIALRFVPTLLEETDNIMKAQASRGIDFEGGSFMSRVKNFMPVLVPLFIACFRRADELALAMDARCYPAGGEGRTRFRQMRMTALDYTAIAAMGLFMTLPVYWRIIGE